MVNQDFFKGENGTVYVGSSTSADFYFCESEACIIIQLSDQEGDNKTMGLSQARMIAKKDKLYRTAIVLTDLYYDELKQKSNKWESGFYG